MVKNLNARCEGIAKYFNNVYAQWDNDSDDGTGAREFPNPFEDPTKLYPMTCHNSFECNGKADEEMTAYCGICNERGHPTCMIEMPKTIKLHDEQKAGAKTFGLNPRLCGLCDNYHGLF
jgi:hypothetical protein